MEERMQSQGDGPLASRLWPVTSYLISHLTAPFSILIFFILNRTKVYGRQRVPTERNSLLLSNHQSMIDSFLIAMAAFYPRHAFLRPYMIPWHPAAEENFFRNRFLAWLFGQLKCIPVRPGRRDLKAVYRSIRAVRKGSMIYYPEGTRSRDGEIGKGRPGAGLVILGTYPTVIPVTIDGMDEVLPIGTRIPRVGKRVTVYIGKPFDYSEFRDRPRSKETAQELVDRVMERLRFQRRVVERLRRRRR